MIFSFKLEHESGSVEGHFVESADIIDELLKRDPNVFLGEPLCIKAKLSECNIKVHSTDPNRITEFIECDESSECNPIEGIAEHTYDEVEEYVYKKKNS